MREHWAVICRACKLALAATVIVLWIVILITYW